MKKEEFFWRSFTICMLTIGVALTYLVIHNAYKKETAIVFKDGSGKLTARMSGPLTECDISKSVTRGNSTYIPAQISGDENEIVSKVSWITDAFGKIHPELKITGKQEFRSIDLGTITLTCLRIDHEQKKK